MDCKGLERNETLNEAQRFCRSRLRVFRDDGEILGAITLLVRLRRLTSLNGDLARRASLPDQRMTGAFHERFRRSPAVLHIVSTCQNLALGPLEAEILIVMIAAELGMIDLVHTIGTLQDVMNRKGEEALAVARALSNEATLVASETITVDDTNDRYSMASLELSRGVVEPLLRGVPAQPGWEVQSQNDLLQKAYPLFRELNERSEELDAGYHWFRGPRVKFSARDRKIEQLTKTMRRTLDRHSDWPISRINAGLSDPELQITFVLIGKEMGYLDSQHELFKGEGLARCVSFSVPCVSESIQYLRRNAALRSGGFIRVCGGPADPESHEDDSILMACEFELTAEFREKLGIVMTRRRRCSNAPRTPAVTPDALVLSEDVRFALDLVVSHARHRAVLFEEWGMLETVPYGKGMVVLFSGPPGVGKTACAESIAHRLDIPIIAANYAELESMWVGETEKNIARVFREATDAGALLLWDECDAMFYDRGTAFRNWEVRQVNVLLQEIERFEGVCVLSTNRKVTLDTALERRIALKVEFKRPDRDMRAQIWRKHIPKAMPLANDIEFERLAMPDMTGGEIKNAVLNAARIALARGPRECVRMSDFEKAIAMETQGRWSATGIRPIGFGVF